MKKSSSGQADQAIERVLELSADAQIIRRKTSKAITAYSKTLAILSAGSQKEAFCNGLFEQQARRF
jgi:hypothetical protein